MGLRKGGKRTLWVRIFLVAILMFFSLLVFVKSADFNVAPSLINVDEDTSNLYNFTIENTNLTTNITQVNITLPPGFSYDGTNGTSSTGSFSNPGIPLTNNFSWSDANLIVNNINQSFWFNATAANPGAYNIIITTLDASSIVNSTNISVTINDTTSPLISSFYPQNASYNFAQNQINYSVSDNFALDSCWYSLDNGFTNSTPDLTCSNFTGLTGTEGSNTYIVYANDSSNNLNSTSVTFFVDSIKPAISIVFPANNSNISDASIDIEYTRSDTNLQSCWYSNDTYSANTILASCGNITNVVWGEGKHNVTVYANDTLGNFNFTTMIFTLDTIQPTISISFPTLNNTNNININLDVNFTASDSGSGLFNFWYSNDTYFVNKSLGVLGASFNITNLTWSEGNHNVRIWVNDSAGNYNFASISFTIDSIKPNIAIVFPANNSNLSSNTISVNYTIFDLNLNSCWYSNDTFLINTMITCGQNLTGLTWSEGQHNVTVYSNDTANNINQSTISFTVDTIAPEISIIFPTNNTNSSNFDLDINYTFSDNIAFSSCWYSNDSFSVNTTVACGQNITNINWTDSFHNVRFYINDKVNHVNASAISFTIDTIFPTLNSSNIAGAFFNGTNFIFSPANQDGLYDSIDIIMNASELIYDWGTTRIFNSSGDSIKTFNSPAGSPDNIISLLKTWDGTSPDYSNSYVPDGAYIINTSFSDFANNINSSVYVATIFIDNSPPAFSNILINPNPPNEAQDVQLNVTLTETNLITNVTLEFNGTNYSVSNNLNEYYFTIDRGNYTAHDLINYTWKANDSLGNFNVSSQQFTVANRVPSFINGPIANLTFVENGNTQQINLSFYFNDSDLEDRNNLIFGSASLQNFSTYSISNGVLTLAPSLGYSGITQVAFFANDSFDTTYSNVVVINVTPVNHVPRTSLIPNITFNEDTYSVANNTLNLSNYFFDDDGTVVSYGTINPNNTGNLSILINNGLVNVTSNLNWNGNASLYFTAMDDDNEFGVSRQVYLIVNPVNDAPQINVPNATMLEDTTGNLNLSNYATDVDSAISSFAFYATQENIIKINCSASGSILTYQPTLNFFGNTYCNITTSDGISNSNIWRFNISVTNVNDAPNITSSAITNATEDVPYVYQINASDTDNLISPGTDNLTYSLTTSPAGMSISATTGIIIWLPTNSNAGNNNIAIKVNDGKNRTAIQSFILNVANVNDLPTIPSLISPANQTTLFVNSTNLNWSVSSDDENNTIIYYVFFSNSTNPMLNKSTTSTSTTINGLEHNQTYYWYVISSDGIGNQTKTETRTFNISLKNAPVINQYFPLTNLTINESNSFELNVSANDVDAGDALTYNWTLNGNSVSNVNNYNFTTNFSSSGTYNITVKVIDSFGLTAERNWRIIVSNNNAPTIISFLPSDLTPVININDSQNFSVSATDPNGDNLSHEWFVDGILVLTNATSYVYLSNISGTANVNVIVTDPANNSASKNWNLIATTVPVASNFSGQSTNLSSVNLSNVQNLILENNFGKINFENQKMNLTDSLDINSNVFVVKGIVAINSTNYPQLNKPATITLKGLSYTSVPKISYSNKFTTNPGEITGDCDFCKIISYASYPTTNGTITFQVEHFSSFRISGSGAKYDFSLFKSLNVCKNGTGGNLSVSIDEPSSGDSFETGNIEQIEANVKNDDAEKSKSVITEISLYDISKDSVKEKIKSESTVVKKDGDSNFNFYFNITKEIDEGSKYIIFAKAYEKGNEDFECAQDTIDLSVETAENKVAAKEIKIVPEKITPGDNFEFFVTAKNLGNNEENNVYIELINDDFGIDEKSQRFNLTQSGRGSEHMEIIQAKIPFDAKEGNYEMKIRVVFGGGREEKIISVSVEKKKETVALQSSGSSVISLSAGNEAKSSNDLNKWFVFFLISGIIIFSIFIIRKLGK